MFTPGWRPCGYKTASGRAKWANRDPIEEAYDINLYRLAYHSPLAYVDPDGRFPVTIVVGGAVGGVWGTITGGWKGGLRGAVSGAVGGAVAGGLMGMVVNPVLAGAAGGTASSVAGRFLAGDPLTGPDSFAQTGFGAITGAGFGLLGSQFPGEVGKRVFVGLGSGTARQAGKTYIECFDKANELGQRIMRNTASD